MKEHTFGETKAVASLGTQFTGHDLDMPRRKRPSLFISLSYRLVWLSKYILGPKRVLHFCLNASWLLRRFAFELCSEVFGDSFQSEARALSDDLLKRWIPPGGSVIDIGCGSGRWCRTAARYGKRVVGIDQSEMNIRAANRISTETNVEYMVGDFMDARDQNRFDRRFDLAILLHVVEHVEDVDQLLQSIAQISSTLIIEVPDFDADPLNMVRRVLGCPYYSDGDHVREYTRPMLQSELERNGWTILHEEQRHGAILAVATHANPE
ncbi:MAG TPA: class I SAM-dependent methyltransferase [Pyrinomonadaceae bacterium]|nr:class I SAM-dependent methyltransferase [Pyrinomonadaceae bacterium]